jgi:hypothetical protein
MTLDLGSVDSPATREGLRRLAKALAAQPGEITPVLPEPLETATCEHCNGHILRDGRDGSWKHYSTLREECYPPPTASPKRDADLQVIPLFTKEAR